jgi:hypothetical protein
MRISSIDWAQLSRFHLKTETESVSETCVLNKNRTMNNVQKHSNCIYKPLNFDYRQEATEYVHNHHKHHPTSVDFP